MASPPCVPRACRDLPVQVDCVTQGLCYHQRCSRVTFHVHQTSGGQSQKVNRYQAVHGEDEGLCRLLLVHQNGLTTTGQTTARCRQAVVSVTFLSRLRPTAPRPAPGVLSPGLLSLPLLSLCRHCWSLNGALTSPPSNPACPAPASEGNVKVAEWPLAGPPLSPASP